MIDINIIRNNPEIVVESLKFRGMREMVNWVPKIKKFDEQWRKLLNENNNLKKRKNDLTRKIAEAKKNNKKFDVSIKQSKKTDIIIDENDKKIDVLKEKIEYYMLRIPNILHESVPKGKDSSENAPIRFWGKPKVWKEHLGKFKNQTGGMVQANTSDSNFLDHQDLCEKADLLDVSKAAKTSGSRFYYFKNQLVILDMALMRFAMDHLIKEGFTPIEPPFMVRREVEEGATSFDNFESTIYKIEGEDLYLLPTSEPALLAYHMGDILNHKDLPKKFAGISPCFRKEAGTHGRDTKGFFRVHHFNKVEQVILCKPEDSWGLHEKMIKITEEIFQKLEIPYRIVIACAGDTPRTTSKMYDLEAWFPSIGEYREAGSCSNCLDWQTRRMKIRYFLPNGKKVYVHALNNTAITNTRALIALLENHQKGNKIIIPKALRPYTGFNEIKLGK